MVRECTPKLPWAPEAWSWENCWVRGMGSGIPAPTFMWGLHLCQLQSRQADPGAVLSQPWPHLNSPHRISHLHISR